MSENRLIQTLRIRNLLSFGSESEPIELHGLNVLIGPNASGKSNLIDAIGLLQAATKDIKEPFIAGGGIEEWLWKGGQQAPPPVAEIDATVEYPAGVMPLRYRLSIGAVGQRLELNDEAIENEAKLTPDYPDVFFFYRYLSGRPVLNRRDEVEKKPGTHEGRKKRFLQREEINPNQSILSQQKDPEHYPEIAYLGQQFGRIRLYRDWNFGRNCVARLPQSADLEGDFLMENAQNLSAVLSNLMLRASFSKVVVENLRKLYDRGRKIRTIPIAGSVQTYIEETDLAALVPATRLSDGTIRLLCLLVILCHPNPPPLICVEEPELGLHPDLIGTIANLLVEAAERTQLVVTTHSDHLVSSLADHADSVLVCERDQKGTRLRRLEANRLTAWLQEYSLGELWMKGEIGGTRW